MPKWFDLDPVDDTFFETAGHRFVYPMRLRAGPEEVWAGLTAPRPLQWVSLLDAEFTSAQPYGVGTTRRVTVGPGLLRMREHFFVWKDAERRHAFYAEQATVPLFRAFAEDYRVTPAPGGCLFTWTFAFDARRGLGPALRAGGPVNTALFRSFVRNTRRRFGAAPSTEPHADGRNGD